MAACIYYLRLAVSEISTPIIIQPAIILIMSHQLITLAGGDAGGDGEASKELPPQ
ncbi:MAG: hypothetical protein OEZ00_07500 [Dehalococcoidia bacterium]|nr:hypothetical protein [Dehalococcoidia bacterium]